jgi:O-antigen ligase
MKQSPQIIALAVTLVSLPLYVVRFSLFGIPTTLFEIIFLACMGFVVYTATRAGTLRLEMIHLWGILLIAIGCASLLVAPNVQAAAGLWKAYILEPVVLSVAVTQTVHTKEDIFFLLKALLLPALVISLMAIVQGMTGWGIPEPWTDWPGRRATAIYGYPNAVGLFLAPIASAAIAVAVHWKATLTTRLLFALTGVISFLAILAARADGAIVAVAGMLLCIFLMTKWRWLAVFLAGIALMLLFLFPQTRAVLTFQDTSGEVRVALWQGTARLIQSQPFTGAGLSGFPTTYDRHRNPAHTELLQYPHNSVLNFWTELGLSGLVWLLGTAVLLGTMLKRIVTAHSAEIGFVLASAIGATCIYGLVDVPYFKNDLAMLCWLWASLTYVAYTKSIR